MNARLGEQVIYYEGGGKSIRKRKQMGRFPPMILLTGRTSFEEGLRREGKKKEF